MYRFVAETSPKPLLTPDEFRDALGRAIGRGSIYELIRAGRIRSIKLGRRLLIPSGEIEAFIERETAIDRLVA